MNSRFRETGNKGLYDNGVSGFITTNEKRQARANWVARQGFNQYACYGMSEYMKTNPSWVADFITKLRANGIPDIGFIYSKSSSVTGTLDTYQRNQISETTKFSFIVSEIEQYNTGLVTEFYNIIKITSNYALVNNLTRCIYQGWPSQADMNKIVKYSDRMFLHAYGRYDLKADVGKWAFSYQSGRFNQIHKAIDLLTGDAGTTKYSVQTIFSTENPDTTKTQFGAKYFKRNTWEEPYSLFIGGWNSAATAAMKRRITIAGSVLFVGGQAIKIKPV